MGLGSESPEGFGLEGSLRGNKFQQLWGNSQILKGFPDIYPKPTLFQPKTITPWVLGHPPTSSPSILLEDTPENHQQLINACKPSLSPKFRVLANPRHPKPDYPPPFPTSPLDPKLRSRPVPVYTTLAHGHVKGGGPKNLLKAKRSQTSPCSQLSGWLSMTSPP